MTRASAGIRSILPWVAAALLHLGGPVAASPAPEAAPVADPPAAAPAAPRAERVGPHRLRIANLVVDDSLHTLRVPGRVNMDRGPVEVLACTNWGKVHESVLVLDVEPYVFQVGLLLLGLRASANPDSADRVAIRVLVDGYPPVLAEDLVTDLRTGANLPHAGWFFRGARVVDDVFTAQRGGTLVATYADVDAILDNPGDSASDDEILAVDEDALPPRGMPVVVEISRWNAEADRQERGTAGARPPGSAPSAGTLPPVVVTASRLRQALPDHAGNAWVRTQSDAGAIPLLETGSLLHEVPGFHLFDATGNRSRWVLSPRGFTASGEGEYVELLVDGIPANELEKGIADFNLLSLSELQRLEVLRGPASSLYGDQATAGVVLYESQPRFRPWVATRGGAFGQFALETGTGIQVAGGYASASAGWLYSDGWRANSLWRQARLFARGGMHVGGGQLLGATFLGLQADAGDPGPVPREWLASRAREAFFPRDGQDARRVLAGVHLTGPLLGSVEHTSRVYLRTRDAEVTRTLAAAIGMLEEGQETVDERAVGTEFRALARLAGGRELLQVGFEAERGALENAHRVPTGTASVTGGSEVRRVKLAPYIQSVSDVGLGFQLDLGARYDRFQLRFDQTAGGDGRSRRTLERFTPRSALNWRWRSSNLYVAGSGVYKIPTLEQLYDQRHPFGLPLSNPDLEAQRGTSFEVGGRLQPDPRTRIEAVYYRIRMRKEISFDAASYVYKNVGKSFHQGVEFGVRHRWIDRLDLLGTYTWTEAFFRSGDVDGKRINGIPMHRGVLGVDVGLPLAFRLGMNLEGNGAQQLDESNTRELRAFAILNARLQRDFARGRGFLQVNNVLDRRDAGSGYVLPFDGAELLYPVAGFGVVLGMEYSH